MADQNLDVRYVAKLARLRLTEEEARVFQEQLGDVLAYADKLRQVDVTGVESAAHAEEALSNAPRQANGLFIVPKVVE